MKIKSLQHISIVTLECAYLPWQYSTCSYYDGSIDGVLNCPDDVFRKMIAEGKIKKVKNLAYDTVDVVKYGIVESNARDVDAVIIGEMRRSRKSLWPIYVSAGWLKRHVEQFLSEPSKHYDDILSKTVYNYADAKGVVNGIKESLEAVNLNDDEKIYTPWLTSSYSSQKITKWAARVGNEGDKYYAPINKWGNFLSSVALLCFAFDSGEDEDMYIINDSTKDVIYFRCEYSDLKLYEGKFNLDRTDIPFISNKQFVRVMNESNETTLDFDIVKSFREADGNTRKVLASVICNSNLKDPVTIGIVAYLCWEYNMRSYCTAADMKLLESVGVSYTYGAEDYFNKVNKLGGVVVEEIYDELSKGYATVLAQKICIDLYKMCGKNSKLLKKLCGNLGVVDYREITLEKLEDYDKK